jgi:5-amino-6-(5-phosphoribosylamino)uracil reductase/diaminohydroxyphosphoribosylaminopyrimidine deaminase/5-amino-6-(5-phosphoribosylamino)uracil reductase
MKITVSWAQTLDGRIATITGDSQWIGGEESLRLAHQLRATHDAVLVGVGTVIADDPRLTTRLVNGPSPLRVVVDSGLRIPINANVLAHDARHTVIVTTEHAARQRREHVRRTGAEVLISARDEDGRVDLGEVVRMLSGRGVDSLLVEGGAGVITSMLRASLCDRLAVCISPRIIGKGIEAVGDLGITQLRDGLSFTNMTVSRCGEDFVLDATLAAVGIT